MAGCCWPWKIIPEIIPAKQVPVSAFISLNLPRIDVGNFASHRACVCVHNPLCDTRTSPNKYETRSL